MWGIRAIFGVFALIALGMVAGGAYELHQQESGTQTVATVTECHKEFSGNSTSEVCDGSWVTGGSLLAGGHVVLGQIDGASEKNLHKDVHVRLHGDKAYMKQLWGPILLLALGGVLTIGMSALLIRT